jgi:hypothetical protein
MVSLAGLGAIGSAIGGIFGASRAEKAQEEANRINRRYANKNIALQKKFAKRGIRWKVRDATKAGLHPLAALGAQTHSFAPVSAGQQAYTGQASAYSQAGQDIGGSIQANMPTAVAQRKQDAAMANLALERAGLENQLLKAQIASQIRTALQPGRGPGHPNANPTGTGDSASDPLPSTLWFVGPDGKPYPAAAPQFPDPEQDIYRQYKERTVIRENMPIIREQILKAPADFLQPVMDFIIPYLPGPIDWSSDPRTGTRRGRNRPRS